MKHYKFEIENNSTLISDVLKQQMSTAVRYADDKFKAVERITYLLYEDGIFDIKIGCGVSHIWISNLQNERQAIIYL